MCAARFRITRRVSRGRNPRLGQVGPHRRRGRSGSTAGSTGEVIVESANIASGYHANPELTAARFSSLPDGRRRYRTGDLGRLDENGELALLGRGDDAIKVRGYLVEPLEV